MAARLPTATRLLATGRLGLAVAGLVAPRLSLRALGADVDAQPATPYLLRLFALRNAFLGLQLLRQDPPPSQGWVDVGDAAAAALAFRAGQLPADRAALAVPAGLVAAALATAGGRAVRDGTSASGTAARGPRGRPAGT